MGRIKRNKNMLQMKEHEEFPEKDVNKMEVSNLPDMECKTMVIRLLKKLSENFNKKQA